MDGQKMPVEAVTDNASCDVVCFYNQFCMKPCVQI